MNLSIEEKQEEIIEDFAMLDGDMEMTLNYLMELGEKLPALDENDRTEENIVKGCQSKVWLVSELNDGRVTFRADSNTAITKGLVSLLVRVYSGQPVQEVMDKPLFFPEKIGMHRFIGTQRSNGFAAMVKQMKLYALAYSAQKNTTV